MAGFWTLRIEVVMSTITILDVVLIEIMIVIVIILIGGMVGDTY